MACAAAVCQRRVLSRYILSVCVRLCASGELPLVVAVLKHRQPLFQWLLTNGRVVVDQRTGPLGWRALDVAAVAAGTVGTSYLRALLDAGASVLATTPSGDTAMQLLCRAPSSEYVLP